MTLSPMEADCDQSCEAYCRQPERAWFSIHGDSTLQCEAGDLDRYHRADRLPDEDANVALQGAKSLLHMTTADHEKVRVVFRDGIPYDRQHEPRFRVGIDGNASFLLNFFEPCPRGVLNRLDCFRTAVFRSARAQRHRHRYGMDQMQRRTAIAGDSERRLHYVAAGLAEIRCADNVANGFRFQNS